MSRPAYLLASDIDGTLIPTGGVRVRTAAVSEFAIRFEGREDIALAYVTGRHLDLALEAVNQSGLPKPDYLACDVGTVLYRRDGPAYRRDWGYAARVRKAFGDMDALAIRRNVIENIPELSLQEQDKQGDFKLSFYVKSGMVRDRIVPTLDDLLRREGADLNVVFSVDPANGRGLLDLLPREISKLTPIRELAGELGLSNEAVVYAGDSGNDEAALLGGYRSIVVGNAGIDLKERLSLLATRQGVQQHLYFARESFAAGVLEGCREFGLI